MSEKWIKESETILRQLKDMKETESRDRLDLVRSTRFALRSLARSLNGWLQWKNNPERASRFNLEELEEINKSIIDLSTSFIEYDIKITKEGIQKRIDKKRNSQRKTPERVFYT